MDYTAEAWRIWSFFYVGITLLAGVYALSVAVFLVLENRSPQMTFAWLLLFYAVPVIGVLIYFMFGRDHWAFSRQNKLMRQKLRDIMAASDYLAQMTAYQEAQIDRLKQADPPVYGRVLELLHRTDDTPLFCHNKLEVLQNGHQ